ncbi:MAG: hypothetical protein ACRDYB_16780, partial [Acidimicrobiales bacterium]
MIGRLVVITLVAWFGFWIIQWLTGAADLVVLVAAGAGLYGRHLRAMARRAGYSRRHSPVTQVAWGWRWEAALGFGVGACFRVGTALFGGIGGGTLIVGLAAVPIAVFAPWRAWLCDRLEACSVDRWFSKALRLCGLLGASGARAVVRSSERVPVGLRLVVEVPAGQHSGHLLGAAPALAASLRVREVRVLRDAADAGLARMTVVQRDRRASNSERAKRLSRPAGWLAGSPPVPRPRSFAPAPSPRPCLVPVFGVARVSCPLSPRKCRSSAPVS